MREKKRDKGFVKKEKGGTAEEEKGWEEEGGDAARNHCSCEKVGDGVDGRAE